MVLTLAPPFQPLHLGKVPRVSSKSPIAPAFARHALGKRRRPHQNPRRQSPDCVSQFLEPPSGIRLLGNLPRRVNVKPPPDDGRPPIAILHSLDPAKDFLGVGLADGKGEHGLHSPKSEGISVEE